MYETWYRCREGNESRRDACQEVRAPDSTDEVGELARGVGGGKPPCRVIGPLSGNTSNAQTFDQRVNGTAADTQQ